MSEQCHACIYLPFSEDTKRSATLSQLDHAPFGVVLGPIAPS